MVEQPMLKWPVDLPVWKGAQESPGYRSLPFALEIRDGIIRLALSKTTLAAIVAEYGIANYSFISTPPGLSTWGNRLGNWYFKTLATRLPDLQGKTVLEIGAGTLYIAERILRELHAARYIACDPTLRITSDNPAIESVNDYFCYENFQSEAIDMVLLINTLEHISEPEAFLAEIRLLLAPRGGYFYVVVPDCERGLQTGDWGVCIHEHMTYFTSASLLRMLTLAGFAVDWLVQGEDTLLALAHLATPFESGGEEHETVLLQTFEQRACANLTYARLVLNETIDQRQPWGMHGCSVGLNNVLALLGVQTHPYLHLFDGDEAKVGKYLPSFHHPIRSSRDPEYGKMSGVIISALTYYDSICKFAMHEFGFSANVIRALLPRE